MTDVTKKQNKWIKIIITILLATIFFVAFKYIKDYFTEERIQSILNDAGFWAPVLYILLWAILPIFLFPVPLLVVPSGYIFGTTWGVIYTLIGCGVNIFIMYYLAAKLARKPISELVEKKSSEKIKQVFFNPSGTSQGVFFIFRLIPLISYNLINYMAGIYLGEQIHDPSSPEFKLAIFFLVLLTLVSLVLLKIYNKRHRND